MSDQRDLHGDEQFQELLSLIGGDADKMRLAISLMDELIERDRLELAARVLRGRNLTVTRR